MKDYLYELIIVISNHGHSDQIMDVAKRKGAKGGTIVHGKATADQETARFFGLKIQPEKELLLIVVPKDLSSPMMKAISDELGPHTNTRALCFSLPVSETLGFVF